MIKTYDEALKTLNDVRTYLHINRADDCAEQIDNVAKYFIEEKRKTPTEEEIIKEWEALGYEIQYWNKNVGIQLEKTIYKDNSAYAWHTIYIDVKTKEYYKHNIHLTYISFTFQEHQLLTKTFKMLGW